MNSISSCNFFIVVIVSSINCLGVETNDICLIFIVGLFLWICISEFKCRKSKDAKWIKKGKGNNSVAKYRESVIGRKLSALEKCGILDEIEKKQFSEVEQEQLIAAHHSEIQRTNMRIFLPIFIIGFLGVYIYELIK